MEELEPVDATQCQSEKKEGSFMTFGIPEFRRCTNPPSWLAVDIREGEFYGAMSLCEECRKVCEIRMPSASFQRLSGGSDANS